MMRVQYRVATILGGAAIALLMGATTGSAQTARPPGYVEAEAVYQSALTAENRVFLQVLLTGAGYWNAVPNENFNGRLYRAIQRFQQENGFAANGILNKTQLERLTTVAGPLFGQWGFRKVAHPTRRNVTIWVPLGLGLRAERNEHGLRYTDPRNRLRLDFTTVPNVGISANYAAVVANVAQQGAKIHFRTMKDGWFVISATTPDGVDWYMRYHQDGGNVTGFTLSWNNANGSISGERIAVLLSASIWSNMTGAMFVNPPGGSEPSVEVARPTPTPSTATATATPPAPKPKVGSSGTGFFVGRDGTLLTNAHVVEDCSTIRVTPDGASALAARLIASDRTNDLALLKVEHRPAKIAALRIGIRLGEPVAAFGFPLSNVLASTGNFTLGNVTALAGIGDDTRRIQISAPVQPGNSGGPLLDDRGNLVGVVTSKLDAIKTVATSGDIPQNVNFALKASAAASFLESNRVGFETGAAGSAMPPADLADHAKALSAFVTCN